MPVNVVNSYAQKVVAGKIVAGPHVRNTCERHLRDKERDDVVFSTKEANRAINFFSDLLKHGTGQFAGKTFELHVSQKFIIGSLFGWKKAEAGKKDEQLKRRFTRAYLEMGKGNGKTPLAAGIALYGTLADGEQAAETYIAATTESQARICFDDLLSMAQQSPDIIKRLNPIGIKNCRKIIVPASNSTIKLVSSAFGSRGSGHRPHIVILDELHEHKDSGLLDTLELGFKSREQPLLIMITNAGVSDDENVCYQQHQYATQVADGTISDDTTFSYVCSLDEDDDPLREDLSEREIRDMYAKTNPLVGHVIPYTHLDARIKEAKQLVSRKSRTLRWNFCHWTSSQEDWISRKAWEECEIKFDELPNLPMQPIYMGLDLSSSLDFTAIAYVQKDGDVNYAWLDVFTPADTLEARSHIDRAPYDAWVGDGHLLTTRGSKVKYTDIAVRLNRILQDKEVFGIAFDSWSFDRFEDAMLDTGLKVPVFQHPQGFRRSTSNELFMPQSIDTLETLILDRKLKVVFNPVLRMAVSGSSFNESSSGLRRFVKGSSKSRIDSLIALTMAIGLANSNIPPANTSPFDKMDYGEWLKKIA